MCLCVEEKKAIIILPHTITVTFLIHNVLFMLSFCLELLTVLIRQWPGLTALVSASPESIHTALVFSPTRIFLEEVHGSDHSAKRWLTVQQRRCLLS